MLTTPSTERSTHLPRSKRYAEFLARNPTYADTAILDRLRETEYARLDEQGHVYLDYTGGGLYADSQITAHMALLRHNVFGNPHSHNPTSLAMTELVEQARAYVLAFFNASPDEYVAIFTPNASGALKLVGEAYPFAPGGRFLLSADDHNSVNGIREFARAKGARVSYVPLTMPELRHAEATLAGMLAAPGGDAPRLFAFPAQSNFSGVKHPLSTVDLARSHGWDVLLDASAFVPTNALDLNACRPDFVALSFYKMFGYPTGVGALLARKSALSRLQRPWFAGGTISIASVQGDGHFLLEDEAGFEDGTVNYLSLPAVEFGLRHLADIGMPTISERVRCLTSWLLQEITALRHANGRPLVNLHGPGDTQMRGGTVTLTLFDPEGAPYSSARVEELAAEALISLRTGCFCNPGSGETAHQLPQPMMRELFERPQSPSFLDLVDEVQTTLGKNMSAIRLSVGLVSNFADVERLINFLHEFLDCAADDIGTASCPASNALRRDTA